MHGYVFGDSHLGCLSFGEESTVLLQNSACGSTKHTNCFFDALLTSVFPCTSQKITLFLLYSAGRHNVTESLALVLVNNLSFKCSPGTPETNDSQKVIQPSPPHPPPHLPPVAQAASCFVLRVEPSWLALCEPQRTEPSKPTPGPSQQV